MPKQLNHTIIIKMHHMGFKINDIAYRNNCSTKQVSRIIKKNNSSSLKLNVSDREIENELRKVYGFFESGEKTAQRFGVSRQAVLKK